MPGMPSAWIFACCFGVISRLIQTKPASPVRRLRSAATLEIGKNADDRLGRLVGVADVARLAVERCGLDVGGEHLAVAVDEIGAAGGDRRVGVDAGVAGRRLHDAEHREPADDDAQRRGRTRRRRA